MKFTERLALRAAPALVLACFQILLPAQSITTVRVASGLSRPIFVTAPPGDSQRIFIVEQHTAAIKIMKNGILLPTPFLDLPATTVITSGLEQGLLGLAFHPDYASNGWFFVHFIDPAQDAVIARYTVSAGNPDVADGSSGVVLQLTPGVTTYSLDDSYPEHNGGMLAFGPDGFLYAGIGDGGDACDPPSNAQNPDSLFGKMLRLDVDIPSPPYYGIPPSNPFSGATAGRDEIWHLGLRNPWRFSFDRATGDMYIGDVGQERREEIDWQPAGSPGGVNFGWRCREGFADSSTSSGCVTTGCPTSGFTDPIHDYLHTTGICVIGGYVYRGCAIPGLEGTYFFADFGTARIWSFRYNGGVTALTDRTAQLAPGGGLSIATITSFGEDGNGEIYICDLLGGEVFKIVPAAGGPAPATLSLGGVPAVGTTVPINLSSPQDPNRTFAAAFSLGTNPGIVLPDLRVIPLTIDLLLLLSIDAASPIVQGNFNTLDSSGSGAVQLLIPSIPALAGLVVYGDFIVLEAAAPSGVARIACPLAITIQ